MMPDEKHILFVAYQAFGHIIPLLDLAEKVSHFHKVTFAVSELKLRQLKERGIIHPKISVQIAFIGLEDGLTEEDDTKLGPADFVWMEQRTGAVTRKLFHSMPIKPSVSEKHGLPSPITVPVDLVIADFIASMGTPELKQRNVPYVLFNTNCAGFLFFMLQLDENTTVVPDETFFEAPSRDSDPLVAVAQASFMSLRQEFAAIIELAVAYITNTTANLESDVIKTMKKHPKMVRKSHFFVAPLFAIQERYNDQTRNQKNLVKTWLDQQKDRSVTYFSFGSMAISAAAQIAEIAKALLALKRPFIWSLRSDDQKFLPSGIRAHINDELNTSSAYLILSWAPQKDILCHRATEVFVTHCGWNSTMESWVYGVPVVAWPMFGDQFSNAPMVERLGSGLAIPDTGMRFKRVVSAEEIMRTIGAVAQKEKYGRSGKYTRKAEELSRILATAVAPGGSSYLDLQRLVEIKF